MKSFKEIFRNSSAYGGYGYRVTSNGAVCHINERFQGSNWKIVRKLSQREFSTWLETADTENTASLCNLVRRDTK